MFKIIQEAQKLDDGSEKDLKQMRRILMSNLWIEITSNNIKRLNNDLTINKKINMKNEIGKLRLIQVRILFQLFSITQI